MLNNDSDPDGDAIAITSVSGAQGGSAILTSGGDVRFTPDLGFVGTAKFTYEVSDGNGGSDRAEVSIVVSGPPAPDPEPEPEVGASVDLWSDDVMPDIITDSDRTAVQLGMKFQSSTNGTVAGIQFYKGPQNEGDNIVRLWSANGDMVASGTFEDDGSNGWQTVNFDQPVAIKAGEVWTASYHAPQGGYSVSEYYFDEPWTNGPLTALEDGGVYAYGSADANPTQSYHASNYWLDVLFVPGGEGGEVDPLDEPTLRGTEAGNTLRGTSEDDIIFGLAGDDRLFGKGGNDVLRGHSGEDVLVGQAGRDILIGGADDDVFKFASVAHSRASSGDRRDPRRRRSDRVRRRGKRVRRPDRPLEN